MKLTKNYIAVFLIATVSLGTCVVPLLHSIGHHWEDMHVEHTVHVHPEFDAWLDASQHVVDTDLDCILCSTTGLTVFDISVQTIDTERVSGFQSIPHLFVDETIAANQGIRGPPAKG